MKRALIITVAALFVLFGRAHVAGQASADSPQEKEAISAIRQRYAAVNKNLSKFRMVKKELSGFSTEGGELTAYFDGAAIVKIAVVNNGETNSFFEEFYYAKEKLIFVYRKQEIYDEPLAKVVKTKENRFYFTDGELIRWVNEDGKQVAASNVEYPVRRIHYLDLSKLLIEGALSRQPIIEAPERNP
jgi:hypothetical protein